MFIYQNKGNNVCVTFASANLPVNPKYIFSFDPVSETISVNGTEIPAATEVALSADVANATVITVAGGTQILSLNGHTISAPEDTVGDGIYKVTKGGTLIINGEGVINGVGNNDWNMALWAQEGKIIINDGTITNVGAAGKDPEHFDLIYVSKGGYVEINGGFFHCQTPRWTLNIKNSDQGTIVVKGGTFVNYNPAESYTDEKADGKPSNFVAEGYKSVAMKQANGDIWYTVIPA